MKLTEPINDEKIVVSIKEVVDFTMRLFVAAEHLLNGGDEKVVDISMEECDPDIRLVIQLTAQDREGWEWNRSQSTGN